MDYDPTTDPRARTNATDFEQGDVVRVHEPTCEHYGVVELVQGIVLLVNTLGGGRITGHPTRQPVLLLERCGRPVGLETVERYGQLGAGDRIYRDGEDWIVVGGYGSVPGCPGLPAVRPTVAREVHYLQNDDFTWLVSRTPGNISPEALAAAAKPLIPAHILERHHARDVAAKADRIHIDNPTVKVKAPAALLDALVVAYEQLMSANAVLEALQLRITGEVEVAEDDAVVPASVQQLARRVAELAGAANALATQLDGAVGHDDVQGALATERVEAAHDAVYATE